MLNVYSGVLKHAKASSLKAETAASIYSGPSNTDQIRGWSTREGIGMVEKKNIFDICLRNKMIKAMLTILLKYKIQNADKM